MSQDKHPPGDKPTVFNINHDLDQASMGDGIILTLADSGPKKRSHANMTKAAKQFSLNDTDSDDDDIPTLENADLRAEKERLTNIQAHKALKDKSTVIVGGKANALSILQGDDDGDDDDDDGDDGDRGKNHKRQRTNQMVLEMGSNGHTELKTKKSLDSFIQDKMNTTDHASMMFIQLGQEQPHGSNFAIRSEFATSSDIMAQQDAALLKKKKKKGKKNDLLDDLGLGSGMGNENGQQQPPTASKLMAERSMLGLHFDFLGDQAPVAMGTKIDNNSDRQQSTDGNKTTTTTNHPKPPTTHNTLIHTHGQLSSTNQPKAGVGSRRDALSMKQDGVKGADSTYNAALLRANANNDFLYSAMNRDKTGMGESEENGTGNGQASSSSSSQPMSLLSRLRRQVVGIEKPQAGAGAVDLFGTGGQLSTMLGGVKQQHDHAATAAATTTDTIPIGTRPPTQPTISITFPANTNNPQTTRQEPLQPTTVVNANQDQTLPATTSTSSSLDPTTSQPNPQLPPQLSTSLPPPTITTDPINSLISSLPPPPTAQADPNAPFWSDFVPGLLPHGDGEGGVGGFGQSGPQFGETTSISTSTTTTPASTAMTDGDSIAPVSTTMNDGDETKTEPATLATTTTTTTTLATKIELNPLPLTHELSKVEQTLNETTIVKMESNSVQSDHVKLLKKIEQDKRHADYRLRKAKRAQEKADLIRRGIPLSTLVEITPDRSIYAFIQAAEGILIPAPGSKLTKSTQMGDGDQSGTDDEIDLTVTDEFGNKLNQKEAFKQQSRVFHGNKENAVRVGKKREEYDKKLGEASATIVLPDGTKMALPQKGAAGSGKGRIEETISGLNNQVAVSKQEMRQLQQAKLKQFRAQQQQQQQQQNGGK